jgi:adenosylcobinamide amidohydrolase
MTAPRPLPFAIDCRRPILALRFAEPQRMLSWSITRPGFATAPSVAWLEVGDADLPIGRDPVEMLEGRLAEADLAEAVGLMTACDVRAHRILQETIDGVTATVVTTVGLGNGEFVGRRHCAPRPDGIPHPGTINTFVHVSAPLADEALVETITIAAEARTVAVLETTFRRGTEMITGTGSDCMVIAAPLGGGVHYAGLHTAVGEAVGSAVMQVTRGAASRWFREMNRLTRGGTAGGAEYARAARLLRPRRDDGHG